MTEPVPDPTIGPEYDGCLWPIDTVCLDGQWEELEERVQERALALASSSLYRLTGYRVGGCPKTVRPCVQGGNACAFVPTQGWGPDFYPGINAAGQWVNTCGCSAGCAHGARGDIILPGKVARVTEVKVDGAVVPMINYRVDDALRLTWVGGGEPAWEKVSRNQDMAKPDTEPGTFSVTYLDTYPVDLIGAQAVALLAMEFAKACGGDSSCQLPRDVAEVSRNGVSYTVREGLFPGGRTQIDSVDAFIEMWNPKGLAREASVWYPGMSTFRTNR